MEQCEGKVRVGKMCLNPGCVLKNISPHVTVSGDSGSAVLGVVCPYPLTCVRERGGERAELL